MKNVEEFVVEYLEREYSLPKDIDLDTFNYVKTGYVDSIGVIQFICMIEDEFGIEFLEEELAIPQYQTIGGLVALVETKIAGKNQ